MFHYIKFDSTRKKLTPKLLRSVANRNSRVIIFYTQKQRDEQSKIDMKIPEKLYSNRRMTKIIQSSHYNLKNLTTRIFFYSPRKFFHFYLVKCLKSNFYSPSTSSYRNFWFLIHLKCTERKLSNHNLNDFLSLKM